MQRYVCLSSIVIALILATPSFAAPASTRIGDAATRDRNPRHKGAIELQNHVPLGGLHGAADQVLRFYIVTSEDASDLSISLSGGSGETALYVREGDMPTLDAWDCRSVGEGTERACALETMPGTLYQIMIVGISAFADVTLVADHEVAPGQPLANAVTTAGLRGRAGEELRFYVDVPYRAENLQFTMSGGHGDVDMYVRATRQPTKFTWDCRPFEEGNEERCTVETPEKARYHVLLSGFSDFGDVNLVVTWEGGECGPDDESQLSVEMLGTGQVSENNYSAWIRIIGDIDADFEITVCREPRYGHIGFSYDPIDMGPGYDQYFTYFYHHLGPRHTDEDYFTVHIRGNGLEAYKRFDLTLANPIVPNPVQPACADIHIDRDEEGIPDCAEQPGRTFYGMPLYDWGARPDRPDIFIEVDYMEKHVLRDYYGNVMEDADGNPLQDHGTEPLRESLDIVTKLFAERGYAVHFDIGDLYDQSPGIDPADHDLGAGQAVPFEEYVHLARWTDYFNGREIPVPGMREDFMPQYFENNPERQRIFYYLLVANSQGGSSRGSSGQAPDTFDYWFYLSMGGPGWRMDDDTPENRNMLINAHASTIFHELGHVLGFSHAGDPEASFYDNYKPNYLSSMNYLYQLQGVPRNYEDISLREMVLDRYQMDRGNAGYRACRNELQARRPDNYRWGNLIKGLFGDPTEFHITYSDGDQKPIDEVDLVEAAVMEGLDLNCDGEVSETPGTMDVNYSSSYEVLEDHDDWGNLYLYYHYLNYQNGKFVINPGNRVRWARKPSDVTDGADLSKLKHAPSEGIEEWVPPREVFEAIHERQNRRLAKQR